MITVTISRIPATIMHENTIKALSVCLSVFTSLFGLCIFIVVVWLVIEVYKVLISRLDRPALRVCFKCLVAAIGLGLLCAFRVSADP